MVTEFPSLVHFPAPREAYLVCNYGAGCTVAIAGDSPIQLRNGFHRGSRHDERSDDFDSLDRGHDQFFSVLCAEYLLESRQIDVNDFFCGNPQPQGSAHCVLPCRLKIYASAHYGSCLGVACPDSIFLEAGIPNQCGHVTSGKYVQMSGGFETAPVFRKYPVPIAIGVGRIENHCSARFQ